MDLNALHTSELGYDRLRRNIKLFNKTNEEILIFCKNIVESSYKIEISGKNTYYYIQNYKLTIHTNANSIITGCFI